MVRSHLLLFMNGKLFNAVEECDLDKVKQLIAKGADINATDEDGNTVLILASAPYDNIIEEELPYLELLQLLLSAPNIKLNIENNEGLTALDTAYEYEMSDCIELLEKAGAERGISYLVEIYAESLREERKYNGSI